jgi:outer membrane immunogenic protein
MNRKLLLLGAAFFVAGINASIAADIPDTYESDWSGLYATLSAGYSNVHLDGEEFDFAPGPATFDDSQSSDGAIFGLGLGYNHDLGDFVIGLEGDISHLTNDHTLEMKNTVDADYDWFATGRVRAGYDFDGTLLYATGGVALLDANFDDDEGFSDDKTFVGWTIGGGLEHMITDELSLRLEGLYADFPREEIALEAVETKIKPEMWLVRAGISWRFSP